MAAAHRGRLEACRAMLRAGADPNAPSPGGDLPLFWALDGGPAIARLFLEYGADPDAVSPRGWTPLSYARAKGKWGAVEARGIYPEDLLRYHGATVCPANAGPPCLGCRSPRESYDPRAPGFVRERGSYQRRPAEP